MDIRKKFWLVLIGAVLGMVVIACSCSSIIPTPTAVPPSGGGGGGSSMAGKWLDPDTTGTITTIEQQNGEFVVVSVINPNRGNNEVTSSSYSNGVLTWTYCPTDMYCVTSKSVSVDSTTLTATWEREDGGASGTTVFQRQP